MVRNAVFGLEKVVTLTVSSWFFTPFGLESSEDFRLPCLLAQEDVSRSVGLVGPLGDSHMRRWSIWHEKSKRLLLSLIFSGTTFIHFFFLFTLWFIHIPDSFATPTRTVWSVKLWHSLKKKLTRRGVAEEVDESYLLWLRFIGKWGLFQAFWLLAASSSLFSYCCSSLASSCEVASKDSSPPS